MSIEIEITLPFHIINIVPCNTILFRVLLFTCMTKVWHLRLNVQVLIKTTFLTTVKKIDLFCHLHRGTVSYTFDSVETSFPVGVNNVLNNVHSLHRKSNFNNKAKR